MIDEQQTYARFAGWGRREHGLGGFASGLSRILLGQDHLLVVDSDGYSERYRRVYYRDIQALVARKTSSGAILNWILGVLLTLLIVVGLATSDTDAMAVLAIFFFAPTALCLIGNTLVGPSCVCHVRTPVQVMELPVLYRRRSALKKLALLGERVRAAQASADSGAPAEGPATGGLEMEAPPPPEESQP